MAQIQWMFTDFHFACNRNQFDLVITGVPCSVELQYAQVSDTTEVNSSNVVGDIQHDQKTNFSR